MRFGDYRRVLRERQVRLLLAGWGISGLQTGLPLALVLVVREFHGFGTAGLVVGVEAVCAGLGAPLRGRQIDARGQTLVLVPLAVLSAASFVTLVAVAPRAPVWALAVLAGIGGATSPPLFSSLRALWSEVVPDPTLLPAAYALHSVANELLFISGPLVVAGAVAAGSARTALAIVAVAEAAGALVFAAVPASRAWRGTPRRVGRLGALASPGMRTLVLAELPIGMVFGLFDVAAPGFTTARGSAAAAGIAIAALALGSMVGGLVYGSRSWPGTDTDRFVVLLGLFAVTLAPIVGAWSVGALVGLMALAGLSVAPVVATSFGLIDTIAPGGTATEAMSWVGTAYAGGAAIGSALGGALVANGSVRAAFAVACACGVVSLATALVRRSSLGVAPAGLTSE